jgi:hypothetical protein
MLLLLVLALELLLPDKEGERRVFSCELRRDEYAEYELGLMHMFL